MTTRLTPLSRSQKITATIIGGLLVFASATLYLVPPNRETTVQLDLQQFERTIAPSEPSAVVIALLSAGLAFLLYALNGLVLTRLSAAGIDVQAQEVNDPKSAAANPANGAEKVAKFDAINNEQWRNFSDNFFKLSSWNGKKVLYACHLSAYTGKPFNLRELCDDDKRMSFDYAFGYLVAANSAGFFLQSPPAIGDVIKITDFNEVHSQFLFNHIKGHLDLPIGDKANKIKELYLIAARFGVKPPEFALPAA